jgi:hypothetical protein
VLGVVVADLVGLGLLLGALYGSRHTTDPDRLVLLMTVAASGLVVSLAGNAVFLLSGLRQVGKVRTHLLGRSGEPVDPDLQVRTTVEDRDGDLGGTPVATDAMTRFHRPTCMAVIGKEVFALAAVEHVAAGRLPCGLCAPASEAGQ